MCIITWIFLYLLFFPELPDTFIFCLREFFRGYLSLYQVRQTFSQYILLQQ